MYQNHWEKLHKAICSINFYGKTKSRILGLSGFRVDDMIVTDDQVYQETECSEVRITFYHLDGVTKFREFRYTHEEFRKMIPPKSHFENLGFASFSPDNELLEGTSQLELCENCNSPIGKDALTISYQPDHNNITLKSALVSSNYINSRGISYIQFDGTVRPGTSGSPLIDYETGRAIGIVSNKEHKIVKIYRELMKNVDTNLKILEKVRDKWFIEEVDPVQVLIVNQNQIKHLSREIFLNFAVKSGYALDIDYLREHLENNTPEDQD